MWKKNRKQQRYERGQGQTWNTHSEHGEKDIEKQSEIRTMMNFAIEQILTGKKREKFFQKKKKRENEIMEKRFLFFILENSEKNVERKTILLFERHRMLTLNKLVAQIRINQFFLAGFFFCTKFPSTLITSKMNLI